MTHRPRSEPLVISTLLVCLALFASCGSDGGTNGDPVQVCDTAAEANLALEDELFRQFNENAEDPDRPSDVDFRVAYNCYQAALSADPNDLTARFGRAMTGLLVLSADSEINDAFDEWDAYLEDNVPFEVPNTTKSPLGIPIGMGATRLKLPFDIVPLSLVANSRAALFGAPPQISRVQAILSERVLPRVTQAIADLEVVGDEPSFTFTVTGRMQGDADEESAEIDQTDILAVRGACHLLKAAIDVAVSYEIGVAEYDSASLYDALTLGSGWMMLRAGGSAAMNDAYSEILDAVSDADAAITALLAETDSQDDDVIKIGPDELSRRDVDSLRTEIPNIRTAITDGFTRVGDWDFNGGTPDVALRVHVAPLFLSPVDDWKALLPGYTVRIERRPWNIESVYFNTVSVLIGVTAPSPGPYSVNYRLEVFAGGERSEFFSGDEAFREPFRTFLEARLAEAQAVANWTGHFTGTLSFSGDFPAGPLMIPVNRFYYYDVAETNVFIPIVVWNANSFGEWAWPDPTMNGLFPAMANTSQLLSTFGIGEDDWEKELEVNWAEDPS